MGRKKADFSKQKDSIESDLNLIESKNQKEQKEQTKCGLVAVLGRPNAGKSSLLNAILGEHLALISHKANATRKRQILIAMQENAQIIFIDTPGLHKSEKLLNKFMLKEALKASGECDFALFLAPIFDPISHYLEFLQIQKEQKNTKKQAHFVLLTKTDLATNAQILEKIKEYESYKNEFAALIPLCYKDKKALQNLLKAIAKHLPNAPFLYDSEILSPDSMRDIVKEKIREAIFENLSDELPYECEVIIKGYQERENLDYIKAEIICEHERQKGMIIGKKGAALKRIGGAARKEIESFLAKKIFLELSVKAQKWSKDEEALKSLGYLLQD